MLLRISNCCLGPETSAGGNAITGGTPDGEAQAAAVNTILDRLSETLDGLLGGAKEIVNDPGVAHEVFGNEQRLASNTEPLVPQKSLPARQAAPLQQSPQDQPAARPAESKP